MQYRSFVVLKILKMKEKTTHLKILVQTEPGAGLPWAMKGSLDGELKKQINDAFMGLVFVGFSS